MPKNYAQYYAHESQEYATINWRKKLFDCFIRVYFIKLNGSICTIRYNDCSIRVYRSINIIFLKILPIMPALCLMLLVTYYAFNYASIIGLGLA